MKTLYLHPDDNLQTTFDKITEPTTVCLAAGTYRQKTVISCNNVTVIGENRETTRIVYDDFANKIHPDGKEYNTFRTYTLCITGENVTLKNLTVENSNTHPETVGQCVALSVNAKSFYARDVNLISMQDTLFLYPFPDDLVTRYRGFIPRQQLYCEGKCVHLFENCKIAGTVDFIFGCCEAYFKGCEIVSLKDERGIGFVAAPAHPLAEDSGFTFIDCDLNSGGAEKQSCYLARPWRDYGKCTFINCRLGEHFNPALFDKWNDTARDKSARFAYYGLKCSFSPAPAPWSRELKCDEVKRIIADCDSRFLQFNR